MSPPATTGRFTGRAVRAVLKDPKSALDFLRMRSRLARLFDVPSSMLAEWEGDLLHRSGLLAELRTNWYRLSGSPIEQYSGGSTVGPGNELLYLAVRALRPKVVVETGVAAGFSSAHILQGLADNGEGHLHSIDLPTLDPHGRVNVDGVSDRVHVGSVGETGGVIPPRLRGRWTLLLGSSTERLAPLLDSLPELDIFFHDSDHSYANMLAEFELAWPHLRPGGLLVADDIGWGRAFDHFCAHRAGRIYRGFQRGLAIRPVTPTSPRAAGSPVTTS